MEQIIKLRDRIDEIDSEIIRLVEKRVELAKEIGEIKREHGQEILDLEREEEILKNILNSTTIDKEFTEKLFRLIIEYCRNEE